ncbi:hypothetical protein N7492_006221 [Penicillium capsulatum]|uniref:Single-strand DNA deaminase toxin A-like C-terminal domain-containing protein n=1 Tax=Penicillium capsulatum TaxID=69766 RepID=A0A9W9LMG4_9EURO|nr:hypothetical protein N7492_006221 [Penicillium capsulatum]
MSGWAHSEWLPIRVSGRNWTEKVLKLASIVGHELAVDAEKDRGVIGQFQASHAEKQLIAYFIDRHDFLPEDKALDPRFDIEIEKEELGISKLARQYPDIPQVDHLEGQREELKRLLWDKDDRILGDAYDEKEVKRLKSEVATIDEQIAPLETRFGIKQLRLRQRRIRKIERQKMNHEHLIRLSTKEPERPLRRATILISAPTHEVCEDCLEFKDKANHFFGLQIELRECTK